MILDFMLLDGEFAVSEFGNWEYLMLLMFGMMYLLLLLLRLLWWCVIVCGGAVVIRRPHIHETGMFARAGSIYGHSTGPALAITGRASIRVLQGFVFDVGVGV
jgi:hypothetical protein